jgi:hypothetical protein
VVLYTKRREGFLVELVCDNCKKVFNRAYKREYNHCFCSKECEIEFKHEQFYMNKECPICKKIFETRIKDQRTYCSINCQNEWQRQNPRTGANHPNYDKTIDHTLICKWCGISFEANAYKVRRGMRFCSKKCRREWYAEVWSQSPEWKQNRRDWAINQLENNNCGKSTSRPQIIINQLLKDMNIKYINEKSYTICAVDNYLEDYNLIIEVMGTYFHCDSRKYVTISYSNQVTRIKMDKIKHSYLKNNYNINILYLWEDDINNNLLLCESIIKEYINNNGILENYHSLNYNIENKNIYLSQKIIVPYMDWNIEDLNKIIDLSVKEKRNKKQLDKWTIFNCEFCGKEKEELTCHYNKSKNHYCSYECTNEGKKIENKKKCHLLLENKK